MANLADLTQDATTTPELQYVDNPPSPIVEPLDGYVTVDDVMDRFPEEVYDQGRDTHLYKFLSALCGDSGAGILKKQSYVGRLQSEAGFLTFTDVDTQYTEVFRFPRLPSELYPFDVDTDVDTLTQDQWNQLHFADDHYYARIKKFFNATRLGNSPDGIQLAAEAGSGLNVDVYENYKAVYDLISDDPQGIQFQGMTNSIHEFILIPRLLNSDGDPTDPTTVYQANLTRFPQRPTTDQGGTYAVKWAINTTYGVGQIVYPIEWNNHFYIVTAETGNSGGTEPDFADNTDGETFVQGNVTYQDIGTSVDDYFYNQALTNTAPSTAANYRLDPAVEHNMVHVLDSIRPVGALMTISVSQEHLVPATVKSVHATSTGFNMQRYVTGRTDVAWPSVDPTKGYWVQAGIENQQMQLPLVNRTHPTIYLTIDNVHAYTEEALFDPTYGTEDFYGGAIPAYPRYRSEHRGPVQGTFQLIFPFLQNAPKDDSFVATKAVAPQTTPLVIEKAAK